MITKEQITELSAPFPAEEVQWRAGATNRDSTQALAVAYIDARAVMDRLDEVLGPMNWMDTYEQWGTGAVKGGIGIRDGDHWVWKYDGADETKFEATKGGFSDAFKRAAVKWGIGRYLYQLPGVWVRCQKAGNTVKLSDTPTLPAWALPGRKPVGSGESIGSGDSSRTESQPETTDGGNGKGNGNSSAWILDEKKRKAFWVGVHEKALTHDFVHGALAVDSLKDYKGSVSDAWRSINAAIDKLTT